MPKVEGLGARQAALRMLDGVLRRGQTLEAAASASRGLPPPDQALAVAIAGESLRRLPDLDALIDGSTRQRLPDDSKARTVLRLALAQKIGLGTPDHAVVATALPLVDGGPRRLVHGVLGNLLRKGVHAAEEARLPETVEQRWGTAWGEEIVHAARRQIVRRPPLDLSFADDAEAEAYAAAHGGISLAPRHVRLQSSSVSELAGFGEGRWWVQDLAASLPARLIPSETTEVLDLCAAPGGKTMQLAAAGHGVTSVDMSGNRLARLRENLERTHLSARLVEGDALEWEPGRQYGAVLLDAPCSATGTFRRHPEVLYRAWPRIIADNAALQAKLVERAARWLRPGGTLVYSVCSLEPEEGEGVIEHFLAAHPEFAVEEPKASPLVGEWTGADVLRTSAAMSGGHGGPVHGGGAAASAAEENPLLAEQSVDTARSAPPPNPRHKGDGLPDFVTPSREGWVRILPGLLEDQGGLDGFFIARLVRRG